MKRSGAVTASSSAAAEAGVAILRQGGNAVDAAVATALASCVADGCNTGLGGYGGQMVVHPVWGDPVSRPMQFDRLRRREFITLLGGAAAAWPLAARAQQAGRIMTLCL